MILMAHDGVSAGAPESPVRGDRRAAGPLLPVERERERLPEPERDANRDIADALAANEETIVSELNDVQGPPKDMGGYYRPGATLAEQAMRPSATFNEIIDSI